MQEYQNIETLLKYEPAKKKFLPEFNNQVVFYLKDSPWIVSEIIGGVQVRAHWDGRHLEFMGKNESAPKLSKEIMTALAGHFSDDAKLICEQQLGFRDVVLFMHYVDKQLVGFDVCMDGKFLVKQDVGRVFNLFGIPVVRFQVIDKLQVAIDAVTDPKNDKLVGLVCEPPVGLFDELGHRFLVKVVKSDLSNVLPPENSGAGNVVSD